MQAGLTLSDCKPCTGELHRRAVERVIHAMHERLDAPMSLKDMSKTAYISRCHFTRVFHQVAGIPPFQFLYALRLARAKQLLLTTERSVVDVCYEVGYNSLGTFTTRFTQLVGLSPCRLRRLAQEINGLTIEPFINNAPRDPWVTLPGAYVTGRINSPAPIEGAIFVGLFRTLIPQGRPVAGTILAVPGAFSIGPIPDGRYYIFAVAFPKHTGALNYLLPDSAAHLVGVGRNPIIARKGVAKGHADLTLRPMRVTDPPILVALPALLTERQTTRALDQERPALVQTAAGGML
jgi:AraC family transcriptional regulator